MSNLNTQISEICALCANPVSTMPIVDGEKSFCCTGCHVVFNILTAKNQLANFEEHPLFQQALRTGLISNPHLIEQIRQSRPQVPMEEREKIHLEILDMWCPSCAEVIRLFLLQHKGMCEAVVDYSTDLASIEYSPRFISKDQIFATISTLGYRPFTLEEREKTPVSKDLYLRFSIAAFCALNVMMFAYPLYATYFNYDPEGHGYYFAWLACIASLPVLCYSAIPIIRRFLLSFRTGIYGMETLVIVGVASSFGLSLYELLHGRTDVYFDSMTVIIAFILLGKIIETRAKFSAKESLLRLNKSVPRRGRKRFSDGSEKFVPVKEIQIGDEVRILAGEKVVLDGVVSEGEGNCDESFMTGEALPVAKAKNTKVLGGSILLQGCLTVRITADADQSSLQKIIEMVERDIGNKSPYVRQADKIVKWFVPVVIGVAVLTACACLFFGIEDAGKTALQTALVRAISILLISCPCAIGIAAPLAESYLMNGLVSLGAIVRNRGCLSILGKETVYAFDKTGTVTEGNYVVLSGLENLPKESLRILKGMTFYSNHLAALSIGRAIREEPLPLEHVREELGKGLTAIYQGGRYLLGSLAFLQQQGIAVQELPLREEIATAIYFSQDGRLLAILRLGDRLRDGVQKVIQEFYPKKTLLLSGDGEPSVKAVAKACGFTDYVSRCLPLQKRDLIDQLRKSKEIVCFIGDGINDAPALTGASVGISVVSASDISIQVSDILLTTHQLDVIHKIRSLAKKGRKIIHQNLFWAFFYNVIGIGLAMGGVLSPIFSAAAMMLSSLMVFLNAKRLTPN